MSGAVRTLHLVRSLSSPAPLAIYISGPQFTTFGAQKVEVTLRPTVSRPVCPGVRPQAGPVTNYSSSLKFSLDSCGYNISWRPL
jgi:hypothetical protein